MCPSISKLTITFKSTNLLVCSLFALIFSVSPSLVQAQEGQEKTNKPAPLTLHTFYQKNRLEHDLSGGYGRLMRYIQSKSTADYKIEPNFVVRALRNFENNPEGCYFPIPTSTIEMLSPASKGIPMIYSLPIDRVEGRIFSHKSVPKITQLKQLDNQQIGVLKGAHLAPLLGPKADKVKALPVLDDRQNVNLLIRGRVKYIFGWIPDTLLMFDDFDFQDYDYDRSLLLFEGTTHIICKKSKRTEHLIREANKSIKYLQTSGQLPFILSKHANPLPYGSKSFIRYPHSKINIEHMITVTKLSTDK